MAATEAAIGYGVTFAVGDGETVETFTALDVEITSITPPGFSRDAIDATHTDSPDTFREYIAGLMDAGEVQIEFNFVPASSDPLVTALTAGLQNYQITFPNDVTWTFGAICTGYSPSAPVEGKMTANATFKVSGKPTLATAA